MPLIVLGFAGRRDPLFGERFGQAFSLTARLEREVECGAVA